MTQQSWRRQKNRGSQGAAEHQAWRQAEGRGARGELELASFRRCMLELSSHYANGPGGYHRGTSALSARPWAAARRVTSKRQALPRPTSHTGPLPHAPPRPRSGLSPPGLLPLFSERAPRWNLSTEGGNPGRKGWKQCERDK